MNSRKWSFLTSYKSINVNLCLPPASSASFGVLYTYIFKLFLRNKIVVNSMCLPVAAGVASGGGHTELEEVGVGLQEVLAEGALAGA